MRAIAILLLKFSNSEDYEIVNLPVFDADVLVSLQRIKELDGA